MPELNIDIDFSGLTLGDVEELMMRGDDEEMSFAEQLNLLDKLIVSEGGARAIPITQVQAVMDLVMKELDEMVNPTSDNGADPESD